MREYVYRILGAFAVWAFVSGPALAFKQTPVEGPAAEIAAPAKPAPVKKAGAAELDGTVIEEPEAKKGVELKIPGIGSLGILPKLDFGLELLYGANEPDTPEVIEEDDQSDDLTIRGTLKHRF